MGKSIFTYYKERLVEIGGNSKCLYLGSVVRKSAYDIGKIFEGRDEKVAELVSFLFNSSRTPITLIGDDERKDIIKNLDTHSRTRQSPQNDADGSIAGRRQDSQRAIEAEVAKLRELKREAEEIERETGRSELFIGYPFVFGSMTRGASKNLIKAPLLLFPVKIEIPDERTVELYFNSSQKVHINPALVFAYAQSKRLNIDALELEYDSLDGFKTVKDVTDYLKKANIKIDCALSKNIYNYARFREPDTKNSSLSVRYAAVLARYPLSNSIYNDYALLEKKNLTNDAINELLRTKKGARTRVKKQEKRKDTNSYAVKMLDYAQSEVVKKVDEHGNMVIYGPPGTGKSQTIVNIITDAICKRKRVLVVSQKRAALDVVYSRLGLLASKAMYLTDETKEKQAFYTRCLEAHQNDMIESLADVGALQKEYNELQAKIDKEKNSLDTIYETLNLKRPFGLSLEEMYRSSYVISKSSSEYATYQSMVRNRGILALTYKEMSDALFGIKSMNLEKTYYDFLEAKEKNPLIDYMLPDIDLTTLAEVKGQLEDIQKSRRGLFNISRYPYYRQVLAFPALLGGDEKLLTGVVRMQRRHENAPTSADRRIRAGFIEATDAIKAFSAEYSCLKRVLTDDGYLAVIDNILRGNTSYIKLVHDALDGYIEKRDIGNLLSKLDKNKLMILNFAYEESKSYQNYVNIIEKLLEIRIYHEVCGYEDDLQGQLSLMVDFPNITSKIYKLREAQLEVAYKLCSCKNSREYDNLYANAKNNKDYLYQISKKQKLWPIRKTMEIYGDFILSLFPCWLLSPENVSTFLPLTKNLFDIVIFDEASQVFIESTIPTIYRGKNIVVAGDAKQLRPSATFMKRYMGGDPAEQEDYSMQAALEVESLLDLAVARYDSANLTYHYRSKYQELIDFSNSAFYGSGLQIAPNISKNSLNRPIERHMVNGKWIDRKNTAEAKEIVRILKHIFASRRNSESIGIISFNSDQQTCIADTIDKEALKDPEFRAAIALERQRIKNGEDESLFIKNLENVQGEERDIIIFSIGYAKNEAGKLYTNFGSLSTEGGENRLNVAITRAKSKIIVVCSIEPEELKVETAKNAGPKLLKSYLMYVRAVSGGMKSEAAAILSGLDSQDQHAQALPLAISTPIEEQVAARLRKLGYKVDTCLGNKKNRISLAVYDDDTDRYLVGVELDSDAFAGSASTLERDVYKPRFLASCGWTVLRVWCRDWWLYPSKVIKMITYAADRTKARLEKLTDNK